MIKIVTVSVLAVTALCNACISPENVRATPEDSWTWQVNRPYQQFAHCVADGLNGAPVHSWFYEAPRPITSFDQQWQRDRITLKSVDPRGVEQVHIQVDGIAEYVTRVFARANNLEALGGGAPMHYVRAYVDFCARA
jgi:hypothetical protein